MNEAEVVAWIRERLAKTMAIQRLILFGSRARGEAGPYSDYDVIVVAESDVPFVDRQGQALIALGKRDFPLDLLVYTPSELDRAAAIPGSAAYWALREGRVYA